MTVEANDSAIAGLPDETEDRSRAQQVAARRRRNKQIQTIAIRCASLAIVLTLWQVFGANIDPVLFTTPSKIAAAAVTMIGSGELWTYLWPSLVVLAIGLTLAATIGIAIGLLLARFWVLDVAFGVYITFLYSTPSVALVPLIVLWAGFETTAKVVILFLFAFFPMTINTYQGVKNVDSKLIEVGRAFRCSEAQLWTNIVLPGALPFIVTGFRAPLAGGPLYRDFRHRLSDRAHRLDLSGRQDVRADRDPRAPGRHAHRAAAVARDQGGAVARGGSPGLIRMRRGRALAVQRTAMSGLNGSNVKCREEMLICRTRYVAFVRS